MSEECIGMPSMRFIHEAIERRIRHLQDDITSRELSIRRLRTLAEHLPAIASDLAKDALLELIK